MSAYQNLKKHFDTLYHLKHVEAMSSWDEAVMMPSGSASARHNALSTIRALQHDMLMDKRVPLWIDTAKSESLENEWDEANLGLIEKLYLKATCLPNELVKNLSKASMEAEHEWRTLRAKNDWEGFLPYLRKVVSLVKEKSKRLSDALSVSPYDALLDEFSPGLTQKHLAPLFDDLKKALPSLIGDITRKQVPPMPFITSFPIAKQESLGREFMALLGFDFNRGRLDISHHPFCGGVPEDVRITTRYNDHEFISSLMGVCHETGHAMYEFGLPQSYLSQPVGEALGMSVHESQSLFVEMNLCRSDAFIELLLPRLKEQFGEQTAFTLDNLTHHYLHVKPGLIRVDADEVTYPLHIILRYELEKALIEEDLNIEALPTLWNEKMKAFFDLDTLANDKDGVMQDVHWPSGAFGYFPAYTMGALISAQLLESMEAKVGRVNDLIRNKNFKTIMGWLREHIHSHGSRYTVDELILKATGNPLSSQAFLSHLRKRYL